MTIFIPTYFEIFETWKNSSSLANKETLLNNLPIELK